ncbi:hypothetical protein HDU87_003269 [Geranomyces variabilis]|uniref:Outer spore wall protein RRT8 n=1 Tax=Geranomyces variabilis TaxID=109894 RepID=A0AAD5XNC1_9FUNG|nr:hypothetical protein HDU87_003269 [Geranomyces variabilis]
MSLSEARSTLTELKQRTAEFKSDPRAFSAQVGNELHSQISTALTSSRGAYAYPLTGIVHFAQTPALYKPIAGTLAKGAAASLGITIAMFFLTFLPQMAVLSLFATPFLGIPGAIVLVLIESWLVINVFVKAFLFGPLQDDLFDRVLTSKGHGALVASAPKKGSRVSLAVKRSLDRFSPAAIARYLITFPLTFIPIAGPAVFFIINGRKMGQSFHARYFQLKGWTATQVHDFEEPRKGAYTAFGTVALALQLVPVVGIFFTATSTVGAALWASDLEKGREGENVKVLAPAAPGASLLGAVRQDEL